MTWSPPTLLGERIILRSLRESDIDALFEHCSNPRMTEYTIFETHTNRETSANFYRTYALPNYEQSIADPFAIALKSDPDTLIGCCGGRWTETKCNRSLEIGYWIGEPHWGKGLATEAVRLLVPFVFDHFHPQRVQAHVMGPNLASGRVLEKAGFQFEGTLRRAVYRRGVYWDIRMYSLLADELK